MNNLEYLNEISKSNRKVKTDTSGPSTSLIVKIILGGALLLAIFLGFGILLSMQDTKATDLALQLNTRSANLSDTLYHYNDFLKSTKLRSIGISLRTSLSSASNRLTAYLSEKNLAEAVLSEEAAATESDLTENLNTTLENARLNGILDRIYASQIQLQVTLLFSLLNQTIERAKDDADLLPILQDLSDNLVLINSNLRAYSDPSA